MPPINLGNFGDENGQFTGSTLAASPEVMGLLQSALKEELPELTIEMNKVYRGGSLIKFVRDEITPEMSDCEIHSIHLEYNLNLIFNPLSKKIDKIAQKRLTKGFNKVLDTLIKEYFLA